MAILDDVKVALRIAATTNNFDTEIQDLINAAIADLKMAGVVADKAVDSDALIKRAIVTYCKSHFGYDNPDASRFWQSYESLKSHLVLAGDYNSYAITFTVTDGADPIDDAYVYIDGVDVPLVTNSQGVATFRVYATGIDIDYTVSKTGYTTVNGSVYVDGQEAEAVTLSAT